MSNQMVLSDREGHALVEQREVTPMELIQSAIAQGAGIDTIERLAKLQREMVEHAEKIAFNEALHRTQAKMRRISADARNPDTKSRYASYAQLDRALRPLYTDEGFSLSFNTADSPIAEHVRVTCDVSHGGHIRSYQIDMPADGKGPKGGAVMNKVHAMGAGVAYGMRYLLKMIFNVAVGEEDNDGNAIVDSAPKMSDERFIDLQNEIQEARPEELREVFAVAYREAKGLNDQQAMKDFVKTYEARKTELQ
jgi:ERF superfamily